MPTWLKGIAVAVLVMATAIEAGNFEAGGLALLLISFIRPADLANRRTWRIALLAAWAAVITVAGRAGLVVGGPQTAAKQELILRLYDLNCSAAFPSYRYPRSVM